VDLYDYDYDEQNNEFNVFYDITKNVLNKNIYEKYQSFFYRYSDYNQINR